MSFDYFVEILEHSVAKNGSDKPITLGHLLAIARMAQNRAEDDEQKLEAEAYYNVQDWGDRT